MTSKKIIGRKKECETLEQIYKSKEAEFLALYGRRRVGKTHLIRGYFSSKSLYIEVSGAKDQPKEKQIEHFMRALSKVFYQGISLQTPKNWEEAFDFLTKKLEGMKKTQKVVLFLDELPWMATKKSGLLQALDYYWNLHWSQISHFILVVCGSAASWILEKLIYAKGGLHKRITKKILLEPYTLGETREFLQKQGISLNFMQVLNIYMAIGGIPHYLKGIMKGFSAAQNIDKICFQKNGLLYNEFSNLFESLFDHAEIHLAIVRQIVKQGNEISREHLLSLLNTPSGGTFTKYLRELEASGFIRSYIPYGRKKRDHYYRVIDEFTLFYLQWVEPTLYSGLGSGEEGYWQNLVNTPTINSWAGYSFENVCFKHLFAIRKALGLDKIACKIGRWRYLPKKNEKKDGIQIDLLFDREDGVITICEIKYSNKSFIIDKEYGKKLMSKIDVFTNEFDHKKQVFLAMVTTEGVKANLWKEELIQNEVLLKDLFNI